MTDLINVILAAIGGGMLVLVWKLFQSLSNITMLAESFKEAKRTIPESTEAMGKVITDSFDTVSEILTKVSKDSLSYTHYQSLFNMLWVLFSCFVPVMKISRAQAEKMEDYETANRLNGLITEAEQILMNISSQMASK